MTTGGCGSASSASGPFYCPRDKKLYIDPTFYEVMEKRLRAPGDFAQAYVIAHEVGHHVQNLIGATSIESKGETENQNSVRVELQADCLAGVWGHTARASLGINNEDLGEALNAAHAIGDDTLGHANERAYTHGSLPYETTFAPIQQFKHSCGGFSAHESAPPTPPTPPVLPPAPPTPVPPTPAPLPPAVPPPLPFAPPVESFEASTVLPPLLVEPTVPPEPSVPPGPVPEAPPCPDAPPLPPLPLPAAPPDPPLPLAPLVPPPLGSPVSENSLPPQRASAIAAMTALSRKSAPNRFCRMSRT